MPERLERRPRGRVGQRHVPPAWRAGAAGRRPRAPADEVQRRHAGAMTERAEHRIGQRALVPRAVVTAAVDEEGRREHHAAGAGAGHVGVDPGAGAPRPRLSASSGSCRAKSSSPATARRSSSVKRLRARPMSLECAAQKRSGSGACSTSSAARRDVAARGSGDGGTRSAAGRRTRRVARRSARWRRGNAGSHSCRTRPA